MSTRGQRAVRDALRVRQEALESAFFSQATVTAVAAGTVTVRFPGATTVQTWPRLNPTLGVDVGDVVLMGGQPGSWMCLGTLSGARDLAARAVKASGNINSDGAIGSVGNVVAGAGLLGVYLATDGGDQTRRGGFVSGVTSAGQAQLRAPDFDASLVAANGQLYVANAANTVARNINAANVSERRLKTEHGVVTGALRKVRALVAGIWSWADPEERADDTVHVGLYVDELAEVLPDAVRQLPTGELGYEPNAVIALLVAAVQEQQDEVAELRERVAALEASPVGQRIGSSAIADQPAYDDQTGSAPDSPRA